MNYKQAAKQAIATGRIDAATYNQIIENAPARVVDSLQDAVGNGHCILLLPSRTGR